MFPQLQVKIKGTFTNSKLVKNCKNQNGNTSVGRVEFFLDLVQLICQVMYIVIYN